MRKNISMLLSGSCMAFVAVQPAAVFAQAVEPGEGSENEIVVTGSRLGTGERFPGTVNIVSTQRIEEQRAFSNDPLQILAATIPSLTPASPGSASNFDITLRGRHPAIFVDGVPMTVPLRDGARDIRSLAPSAIGSIEVISGSTSIYGIGGAGGTINYVTTTPSEDGIAGYSNLSLGGSVIHPEGSMVGSFEQSFSVRNGPFKVVVSGMAEQYNSLFDADGDRLPPNPATQGGIADTFSYNMFGKMSYDVGPDQIIQLAGNYFHIGQDTPYRAGAGVFGSVKTPSVSGANPIEKSTYSRSAMTYLQYVNGDLLGSRVNLQAYYGDKADRYRLQAPGVFGPNGDQTEIFSTKYGVRFDATTPINLFHKTSVQWGLDYGIDKTHSTLALSGKLLVPHIRQTTLAPFAQAEVAFTDWLNVQGGVRYENFRLKVEDFTTVFITAAQPGGLFVLGGKLKYSKAVFNLGATVDLSDQFSVFAAYSQGYSVADIGRVFLFARIPSVETFQPEAQVVDSYEAGVRAKLGAVRGSLTAYVNKSALGSTFNAVTFELVRSKERIWGVEAKIDASLSSSLEAGATFSLQKGKRDSNNDGKLDLPLDTTRIAPTKVTAYAQYQPWEDWNVRLQALYAAKQDRFPGRAPAFGTAPINSYFLVDASVSAPVGTGVLTLAITNLLNHDYYLPAAIRNALATTYVKGPGTGAQISYRIRY